VVGTWLRSQFSENFMVSPWWAGACAWLWRSWMHSSRAWPGSTRRCLRELF